jgi:hypothetical protein
MHEGMKDFEMPTEEQVDLASDRVQAQDSDATQHQDRADRLWM